MITNFKKIVKGISYTAFFVFFCSFIFILSSKFCHALTLDYDVQTDQHCDDITGLGNYDSYTVNISATSTYALINLPFVNGVIEIRWYNGSNWYLIDDPVNGIPGTQNFFDWGYYQNPGYVFPTTGLAGSFTFRAYLTLGSYGKYVISFLNIDSGMADNLIATSSFCISNSDIGLIVDTFNSNRVIMGADIRNANTSITSWTTSDADYAQTPAWNSCVYSQWRPNGMTWIGEAGISQHNVEELPATNHQLCAAIIEFENPDDVLPPDLDIIPQYPFCEDQDAIFTLDFPDSFNNYRLHFGFNPAVCSPALDFEGYRDLSIYNLGQAFSTTTLTYGSSTLSLCAYLVDNVGDPVSISTYTYDVYASTSETCAGIYNYDYDYWCQNVCDDISTSTFGGELACGGRRLICWTFTPHDGTKAYFSQAWNNIKRKFPFSLYFDITDAFQGFSTSSSEEVGFKIPVPHIGEDGRATLTMETIIDQDFTKNLVGGEDNWNFYRESTLWILWIATCIYVLKRLHKD